MKKKIIIILIIIAIIPLSIIIYPVIKNNNYNDKLLNDIYSNTKIKDITYLNKNNNYYIIKTKEKILVLDLNYEEKLSLDINKIKESNLELVYRRNDLYYKETIKKKEKLIYNFYDVTTNELVFSATIGGA